MSYTFNPNKNIYLTQSMACVMKLQSKTMHSIPESIEVHLHHNSMANLVTRLVLLDSMLFL